MSRAIITPEDVLGAVHGTDTFDETLVARCIDAASDIIETRCQRRFAKTDYDVLHSGSAAAREHGVPGSALYLADPARYYATPNVSACTVTENGVALPVVIANVDTLTDASSVAFVLPSSGIVRRGSISAGVFVPGYWRAGYANIRVVYTAGFDLDAGEVPHALREAAIQIALILIRQGVRGDLEQFSGQDHSYRFSRVMVPEVRDRLAAWTVVDQPVTVAR